MHDKKQIQFAEIYQQESGRVLASLIRILGDMDLAEEGLQEAFSQALESWSQHGIPENPCSWLISAGKFKMIDRIRRQRRGRELIADEHVLAEEVAGNAQQEWEKYLVEDDQLRLIFYCCHPLLPLDARIALSLREVCGMTTAEIASAYLVPLETMKKRLSRAKKQIKEKGIPFEIPGKNQIRERLVAVMHVIYLIFNEGYSASRGEYHIRVELTEQAIFLGRKLVELQPDSEAFGLLALLLLQASRHDARTDLNGDIIPLDQQNRSRWDRERIDEGLMHIQTALMSGRPGPYTLQAAIASVHAQAESVETTQWPLIVDYYDMLLVMNPTPVIELNRAIAIGMHEGPQAGLVRIEALMKSSTLTEYHGLYAARAEFLVRQGRLDEAKKAYEFALARVSQLPEARYLQKQLEKIR